MNATPDYRRRTFWRRIHGRIVFVLLALLIPTLLIQMYIFYNWYHERRQAELNANLEMARAVAKAFEVFVNAVVRQEYALGFMLSRSNLSTGELRQLLEDNRAEYPSFLNLVWVSPDGVILVSHFREIEGQSITDRNYFQDIVSGREWSAGYLQHAKSTGQPVIAMARAIRDKQGDLLGVVAASILADRLDEVLRFNRSKGGAVSLVDSNGMLVFRYPSINTTSEQRNWIGTFPEFAEALKGKEISKSMYAPFEGKNRLVGVAAVPSIGWAAGAGRTEEIAMSYVVSQLRSLAVIFLLVTLGAFAFALVASRRISGPIEDLRDSALALGRGEDINPDIAGPVEVKELAHSLSEMAERLQSREGSLREQQELLNRSEEGLRLFIENAPASLAMFDREMRYLSFSRAWLSDYNLGDRDLKGLSHYDVFPEISEEWKTVHRRALAGEVLKAREDRADRADGSVQWLRWEVKPWYDAAGDVGGIVIFSEDITERKQLAGEIESLARFPDENPSPVLRVSVEGELLYANKSGLALLESVCRERDNQFPIDWHRDAIAAFDSGLAREIEVECTDMVYSLILSPIENLGYVNIYGLDITGRKHAEARLASDLAALTRIHELSGRLLGSGGLNPLLQEIMNATAAIVGAEMGTLQLLEGDSLRLVAAYGHQRPFIEFFASDENQASVYGEATRRGERVVVSDVETSILFAETPSLPVLREAGVRAVQSTPIISRNGTLLGILTTQWKVPYTPNEHDLWRIDLLARQTADLIDHALAEGKLFETHQRLKALMDALPVGVSFSNDPTCQGIAGNPAVLAQFEAGPEDNLSTFALGQSAPGRQVRFFKNGRLINDAELPLQRAVAEKQVIPPMELEVLLPSGRRWFTETCGSPIVDAEGKIMGGVAVTVDITERKRMEDELRKARDELEKRVQERTAELERSNQALQDFAYIASHDMKEPLRKVISFGNMLRQKHEDALGETGNDYLNRMLGATQRMQSLLTSLLEYSRVTMNPEPFQEVDLYDIIHEVLSDLEVRIIKTGGKVQVGKLPSIAADPAQMRQLFQNLIGNALKFHKDEERPIVKVSCTASDTANCQIEVEDNGIGFEEEFLDKIFAPFQRLHGRSSQYEGAGMGLAICKKIVERHGGSITAKSAPEVGSTFLITLPIRT